MKVNTGAGVAAADRSKSGDGCVEANINLCGMLCGGSTSTGVKKLAVDDGGSEKDVGRSSGPSEIFAGSDSGGEIMGSAESLIGIENYKSGEDCDMLKMVVLAVLLIIAVKVNTYAENKIEFQDGMVMMYGHLNLEIGSVSECISQASAGLAGSAENGVRIFKFWENAVQIFKFGNSF